MKQKIEGGKKIDWSKVASKLETEYIYGMKIIQDPKCKLKVMEYRGDYCHVHPFLYGCLKVVDGNNWEAFFKFAGITFKQIKTK